MKQFIYLDTDLINSIIAQEEKGLVLEFANEDQTVNGKTKRRLGFIKGEAKAEGGLFSFAKVSAALSGGGDYETSSSRQIFLKEIATKILHDAAFDEAYKSIKKTHNLDSNEKPTLGEFREIKKSFSIIDFVYLEKLFSENKLLNFFKKQDKERIEAEAKTEVDETLTRDQRRHNKSSIEQEIKNRVDANNQQYDGIVETLQALKAVIPFNRMLISEDAFLVPLEDKYFRDNADVIGFKHSGKLTCIGYATNILGDEDEKPNDIFTVFQNAMNEVLRSLLPTVDSKIYILHPLAVYYVYGDDKE